MLVELTQVICDFVCWFSCDRRLGLLLAVHVIR
jgi:hypothetical protein